MLKKLLRQLGLIEGKTSQKLFHYHSFTYYVPAPPPRQSGYRETQFDQLLTAYLNQGYELLSTQVVAHHGERQAGFWLLCLLRAPSHATHLHTVTPVEVASEESEWRELQETPSPPLNIEREPRDSPD